MDGMQFAAGRVALASLSLLGLALASEGWNAVALTVLLGVAGISVTMGVKSLQGKTAT